MSLCTIFFFKKIENSYNFQTFKFQTVFQFDTSQNTSSAKSERVFSTGGNLVTKKRDNLAPKKVERLIIIAENKQVKHIDLTNYEFESQETNILNSVEIEATEAEVEEEEEDDIYDDDDSDDECEDDD